jgi:DNA-binding GntR family transcriptional regulator
MDGLSNKEREMLDGRSGEQPSFDAPLTLSSAVVAYIRDAILRGIYPPGSPLPEIPLAKQVGASRTTVREALRSLSEAGLVTIHPRRGAAVGSMSPRRARELFTLRAVLEAFAVRLALTEGKIRQDELAQIEVAFEQLRRSRESGDAYAMIEADMAFHWAVCRPCRHEILLDQLSGLQTQTRQFIFYTKFYSSDAEGEVEAHMPILMAVRLSSPERAEAAMRDHIISAGERLLVSMLEQAEGAHAATDADSDEVPAARAGR